MSNKRLKKQTEKVKERSRRDNSESDFEQAVMSPEKLKLEDKVETPVIPELVHVNSEKLVDSCKSE